MPVAAERLNKREREQLEALRRLRASCSAGVETALESEAVAAAWRALDAALAMRDRLLDIPGLYDQIVRSLHSVPANWAEGVGRADTFDHIRFLKIARGSAYESFAHAHTLGDRRLCQLCANLCQAVDDELGALVDATLRQTFGLPDPT